MIDKEKQSPAETVSIAAEQAARVVKMAVEEAKKMVDKATETASEVVEKQHTQEEKLTRIVSGALKDVFGENEEAKRFIDVSKIPLICKSILDIHSSISEIRDIIKEHNGDHETRLRAIEKNMWKWIGVLMIIPPVVTILIAILLTKIK